MAIGFVRLQNKQNKKLPQNKRTNKLTLSISVRKLELSSVYKVG